MNSNCGEDNGKLLPFFPQNSHSDKQLADEGKL